MFFVGGLSVGIFIFSNTVDRISDFWNSSYMGRYTLMDWLHLPTGVIVAGIVILAMFLFWGAEVVENAVNGTKPDKSKTKYKLIGAASISVLALIVAFIGQPTPLERYQKFFPDKAEQLANREVQIEPPELLSYIANDHVRTVMLDVRDEADYNLFHIKDAKNVSIDELPQLSKELMKMPANTLFVVMSNDEARATEAWKILVGESVDNVYILEGGINNWLATYNIVNEEERLKGTAIAFAPPEPIATAATGTDTLRYEFPAALGDQYPAAEPNPEEYEFEFTPKVKLKTKQPAGGG